MAVIRVFENFDLRYGVDGLRIQLKAKRIALSAMKETDFVLFMNKRRNQVKLISFTARGTYLTIFKTIAGRIQLSDLVKLPELLSASKFKNAGMEKQVAEFLGGNVKITTDGEETKVV